MSGIPLKLQGFDVVGEPGSRAPFAASRRRDGAAVLLWPVAGPLEPDAIERLERDVQRRSAVGHPWVLEALEVRVGNQGVVLVTAPFDGISLSNDAVNGLDLHARIAIAVELGRALAALHDGGFVEGELTPSEVLVDPTCAAVRLLALGKRERARRTAARVGDGHAYRAPECWLNAAPDARSDLYALGALLYPLFTGFAAYAARDLPGAFHEHLARRPKPPRELVAKLPLSLSHIVMRLLEKDPERRYQSAHAVAADFERCLEDLRSTGESDFEPGKTDWVRSLGVSTAVFGRDRERSGLRAAFARVCESRAAEIHLVHGPPGIGKSALVHSIELPVVIHGGWFVSGKLEQLQNSPPLAGALRAMRTLASRLSLLSDHERQAIRDRFSGNAEGLGAVLVEIFGELEVVLGAREPPPPLPPQEALARQTRALGHLLRVVAEHRPLLIFIDDVQWADHVTLTLVQALLSADTSLPVMFVLAYRDSVIQPGHPLESSLAALRGARPAQPWPLGPIDADAAVRFLSSTLKRAAEEVLPLASRLIDASGGNPLLLRQQLISLRDRGRLELDPATGWRWNDERLELASSPDVQVLRRQLAELGSDVLVALQVGALFGTEFALADVGHVVGRDERELEELLIAAVGAGIVAPTGSGYSFAHDRLQEVVLETLDGDARAKLRVEVGRRLRDGYVATGDAERLFGAVAALSAEVSALQPEEQATLGRLCLAAALGAKRAGTYRQGCRLARQARELLPASAWASDYEHAFWTYRELCELVQLSGDSEVGEAEALCDELLERARTDEDRATAYSLLISQHNTRARYDQAIIAARRGLALVGVNFPDVAEGALFGRELAAIDELVGQRSVESLLSGPVATDPRARIAVALLGLATPALFIARPDLLPLCVAIMTRVSLASGNVSYSAYAYAFHGFLKAAMDGAHEEGVRWAELGMRLAHRFEDPIQVCRTSHLAAFFLHYVRPYREAEPLNLEGFAAGAQSGDMEFAGYHAHARVVRLFVQGTPLAEVRAELERSLEFTRSAQHAIASDIIEAVRDAVSFYTGAAGRRGFLHADANGRVEAWTASGSLFAVFVYRVLQAQALMSLGRYEEALVRIEAAKALFAYVPNSVLLPVVDYVSGVIHGQLGLASTGPARETHRAAAVAALENLDALAARCPANFQARADAVRAHVVALDGEPWLAAELFDRAGDRAQAEGQLAEAGLAYRLLEQTWERIGKRRYAVEAADCSRHSYRRWGARALLPPDRKKHLDRPDESARLDADLDSATMARVWRAVSRSVDLDEVVGDSIEAIVEHAGASLGVLLLEDRGELVVAGVRSTDDDDAAAPTAMMAQATDLVAMGPVQQASATGELVLVEDARSDQRFVDDQALRERDVRSVLVLPLTNQGRRIGLFYLENSLVPRAFGAQKLGLLRILAAEAAISVENARLYRRLAESEGQFRAAFEQVMTGIVLCTLDGRFQRANERFCEISGYDEAALSMMKCTDLTAPDDVDAEMANLRALRHGEVASFSMEKRLVRRDGDIVWVEVHVSPRFEDGRPVQYLGVINDISARKRAEERVGRQLKEKETLIHELHHRVKNNLQVVASLLYMEARNTSESQVEDALSACRERIGAMTLVHDRLYEAENLASIDFAGYLRELVSGLKATYLADPERIAVDIDVEADALGVEEAVPCGLLASELLTNALKHAFPDGRSGAVRIGLRPVAPHRWALTVTDDGVGFPASGAGESLGLRLVNALAEQLDGQVELGGDGGARVAVTFSTRAP